MKYRIVAFFVLLLSFKYVFSQDYQVTKLSGNVYDGNKLLSKGEWIKALDKLAASSVDAAIRLVSTKDGAIVISFANGKKVIDENRPEKSELYELVVQEYVNKFIRHKQTGVMGVPGEFDWFNYFFQYPDSLPRRMLIIEGQKIPFQTQVFPKTSQHFDIFATTFTKRDSFSFKLPIVQDSISFPASAFSRKAVFDMQIYLAYKDKNGLDRSSTVTKVPVEVHYLTKLQLRKLIDLFRDNSDLGYGVTSNAKSEFYSFLDFNFVKFYYPFVESQINGVFK